MPGYLPPQGYKDPYKDSELTYRASLLPIGTYADPNGGHDTLGFAWPGAIQEPMNALSRLIGTPNNPGTLWNGPDSGSNAEDMRTLLETFFGGQATKGAGAVEKAALEAAPSSAILPGQPLRVSPTRMPPTAEDFYGRSLKPGEAIHFSPDPTNDLPEFYSRFNHQGREYNAEGFLQDGTANVGWIGPAQAADWGTGTNALGRGALRQWRDSFLEQYPDVSQFTGERVSGARDVNNAADAIQTIPSLFSDTGKPSLWGAVINALTGGNATRGMGAVERGAALPLAEARSAPVAGAISYPGPISERGFHGSPFANGLDELARRDQPMWGSSDPNVADLFAQSASDAATPNIHPAQFDFQNPMVVSFDQPAHWGDFTVNGKDYVTPELAQHAKSLGHDGIVFRNIDEGTGTGGTSYAALQRGTVTSPLTGETLFSDNLPSLWGSALQGQQTQTYPNALFGF